MEVLNLSVVMFKYFKAAGSTNSWLRVAVLLGCLSYADLSAVAQTPSNVMLAWNASTSPNVVSYNLYYGRASQAYTNLVSTGNTNGTIPALTQGATYFFAVTAVDAAGLESPHSAEVSYTVPVTNTTPPSVALASPANGASYVSPAAITISANVTANGHTITAVKFLSGGALLGQSAAAPYSFLWTNVGPGSYSLTAQAIYDSGSNVSSAPANISVASPPPPMVALTSPANGASYVSPASITLSANVTPNGHTITSVQFFSGGALIAQTPGAPYSFLWTNVGPGNYSLTAQAVYDSGSSVASAPVSISVVSPPPPLVALTSPANGASYVSPAAISLSANVTPNGNTISAVQFLNGGALIGQSAAAPYSFLWTNVGPGNYSLTAQAVYGSGSNVASAPVSISVASPPPPMVALTSPANGASYVSPAAINLSANVTPNGHTISAVQFLNGGALLGQSAAAPYSFLWTNVGPGSYALTAQAVYDSGSNVASAPVSISVASPPPPSVVLVSPTNGASYLSPAAINLSANVTPNGNTISAVQFLNGGALIGQSAAAPYSFLWTNVGPGNYSLTAQAVYDSGSNVASASISISVVNPPPPPAVVLVSPTNGASYLSPAAVNLSANVTPNGHTITAVQFLNGGALLGQLATAPYSFMWTNVAPGNYSLTAQAVYDSGSSVASAPVDISVASPPPPSVVLVSPTNGASYATPANIALSANVTPNGHTITTVQFLNGSSLLGQSGTAPYNFVWTNVGAGSYSLTAQAVYDSGSNVASTPISVTVTGLPAPSIVLSSPTNGASFASPADVTLAADVTPNGHAITTVQFLNGGAVLGQSDTAPYSFLWTNVGAGSYFLTAQAVYDNGSNVASSPVSIAITGLLAPWQTLDIGSVAILGSATISNGLFTAAGAGNISGYLDNFRFLYQTLSADGEIRTQLSSVQQAAGGGYVGAMIRETLTSGSRYALMGVSPSGAFRWQRRKNTGGLTSGSKAGAETPPNAWVRLVRSGDLISGYKSLDGINWTLVNSNTISMSTNVYVGLAVSSGSSNVLDTSTFTNLSIVP